MVLHTREKGREGGSERPRERERPRKRELFKGITDTASGGAPVFIERMGGRAPVSRCIQRDIFSTARHCHCGSHRARAREKHTNVSNFAAIGCVRM